ncbi:MAG: glycerophosphodiester phosphodiesterase [Gammaproteobacteria bacterium]|nr:glycerophosphodiester phosphodiesterase [Gammaproteobacteria bacterium]
MDRILAPIQIESWTAKIVGTGLVVALTGLTSMAHGFDLQGHRGARGLMPENTLPGFAKALAIGVTTLELDLAVTADSRVVVSHNLRLEPEIARYPNGEWLVQSSPTIHSMTLATVKSYDVGRLNPASEYAERYPGQQPVDGTSVPTLGEVFELVNKSGSQSVRFNIEVKINPERPELTFPPGQFVRAVIDEVRRYQMEDRVVLQSFDWRALREVQDLAPEITTSYLTVNQRWMSNLQTGVDGSSPWLNGLDVDNFDGSAARAIKAAGGDVWSAFHREVDAESIKLAHDLGLSVSVWTVNETSRMHELIEMGVDSIITDYPDRLRRVMVELGLPVPVSAPVNY